MILPVRPQDLITDLLILLFQVAFLHILSSGRTEATTEDISGLTEGYYRVTVTDANGCSKTDSVESESASVSYLFKECI